MRSEPDNEPRRIAVPGYPGLFLLVTDMERYPGDLLARLAHGLAQAGVAPDSPILIDELRSGLKAIHTPEALHDHPLALRLGRLAEGRGEALAAALRAAIGRLEDLGREETRDRRGAIMRLRYLDMLPVKALCSRLYISESHYHRLHGAALEWVAADLLAALRLTQNTGDL